MNLKIYPVLMSKDKHRTFKMACFKAKMTMKDAFTLLIDEFIREQKLDEEKQIPKGEINNS